MEIIFNAIRRERQYQDEKWGTVKQNPHAIGRWILIASDELGEALFAHHAQLPKQARRELLQAAAVIVACLEQHGVAERQTEVIPSQAGQ